jgi:hypothetical protein
VARSFIKYRAGLCKYDTNIFGTFAFVSHHSLGCIFIIPERAGKVSPPMENSFVPLEEGIFVTIFDVTCNNRGTGEYGIV